ncbi:MAG: TetR/AcrR family transcriptional regulator [Firmicutes bacterium]|nr:TetR/AcrR family transcriptional regulator [Bacillota bacterium]
MPRALTEQEKCAQCQRLLEKGKAAVLSHGIRKVSVDDIAKVSGMAKGTFYQHFESKEKYLYAFIKKIHHDTFTQARQIIFSETSDGDALRLNAHNFLKSLFTMPEMAFFIQNEPDIVMLLEAVPNHELQSFKQMEADLFGGLLRLAGINTEKIKPGIVHNYVHALFLMRSSDLMTEDDLPETVDLITNSLISYIFGDALNEARH